MRKTSKPSLDAARRELVQIRMPGANQREVQRVGHVRPELSDVAWTRHVHDVGAERANRFYHTPAVPPQQQVVP